MTITPKKILLVHNNPEERGRLAIMLSRFGHEVRFSCGKGCPDQLSQANDLVIVDDKLAGQSGLDFINQISGKQCEKVIYLSPLPSVVASMETEKLNIYEWITKPVDPLKLAVVVCDYFVESAMEHAFPG
ncbi:MAG: response regulator transcription factor [Nitrospinae bacterium]|nr:response regulator transcription factor [Nitrospinota bacterium]MZH05298.1 response regulator transcription factor [Nitrospinota bacterium]